jgi:hypothetical protein
MSSRLAALRVERRRVSIAVLEGERLDYADSRQLPSILPRAIESACAYIGWILNNFTLYGVAIEENGSDPTTWKAMIGIDIRALLKEAGIPIFEVEKGAVLSAFAHPSLRYRTELRKVISTIWPILPVNDRDTGCLDAAALGLYVQVERLFLDKQ